MPDIKTINDFKNKIEFCYPEKSADREIAREAVIICKAIQKFFRQNMGLSF
jgi:hypothetical protein